MALCHNCDTTRIEYTGNGTQTDYTFPFEYNEPGDIAVGFYSEELVTWYKIDDQQWGFKNDTVINFKKAPANGQKLIIYRCTDLEPLPAEFFPGSTIKAQDLNDNFFVLKSAIEEVRCEIERQDTLSRDRYWNKQDETIRVEDQTSGEVENLLDDEHIFDAEAIAARHDNYVQPTKPASIYREQEGKIWNDTDDLQDYFWDPEGGVWVSFTKTGPAGSTGKLGPPGPPGHVIIGDNPPLTYPDLINNEERALKSGDLWWDSLHVLLYVFYEDSNGAGQWVSVSKSGPEGKPGQEGQPGQDGQDGSGGIGEAPEDGKLYGRQNATWEEIEDTLSFTAPLVKDVTNNVSFTWSSMSTLP